MRAQTEPRNPMPRASDPPTTTRGAWLARLGRVCLVPALALGMIGALSGAEPAPTQIALVFGDYLMGPCSEPANRLLAACPATAGLAFLKFGVDAHRAAAAAGPEGHLARYELWKVFAREKTFGELSVKSLGRVARVEHLPWRALILETRFRLHDKHGKTVEDYFAEAVANLKPQVAGARQAGVPVWLYMTPDRLNAPAYWQRGEHRWTKTTIEERVALLDGWADRLHEALGVPVLPGYRPFALLRLADPDLDLHAPCGDRDNHLSAGDGYVVGCLLATALAGQRLDEPADLDGFFTRVDAHRAHKAKKRGEDPPPPTTIAPEVLTRIHDAAWTTVQGVPGLAPDATAPAESTRANP